MCDELDKLYQNFQFKEMEYLTDPDAAWKKIMDEHVEKCEECQKEKQESELVKFTKDEAQLIKEWIWIDDETFVWDTIKGCATDSEELTYKLGGDETERILNLKEAQAEAVKVGELTKKLLTLIDEHTE